MFCLTCSYRIVEVESQFRSLPCFHLRSAGVQSKQRFVNIDTEYFNLRWNKIIVKSYWCKKNYLENKYVYYPRPMCRSRYHQKLPKYVSTKSFFFFFNNYLEIFSKYLKKFHFINNTTLCIWECTLRHHCCGLILWRERNNSSVRNEELQEIIFFWIPFIQIPLLFSFYVIDFLTSSREVC